MMNSLAALLPLLPAKQRKLHENDWMLSDCTIACPDPNCGARFKITWIGSCRLRHSECTVVDLQAKEENKMQRNMEENTYDTEN